MFAVQFAVFAHQAFPAHEYIVFGAPVSGFPQRMLLAGSHMEITPSQPVGGPNL